MGVDIDEWTRIALESARKLEKEGYEFYTQAAQYTLNPEGKRMFQTLAGQEVKHYETVNRFIALFGGRTLEMSKEFAYESGVFKETGESRINENSSEIDALNIAREAEKKSIAGYTTIYGKTDNKELKAAMKQLVLEEKKHLMMVENTLEKATHEGVKSG